MQRILRYVSLLVVTGALLLAACTPGAIPEVPPANTAVPGTDQPGSPPKAVLEAQAWLSGYLDVPAAEIEIINIEQAEWSDSCLGLGGPAESCLQAMTPGWRVEFQANDLVYTVRTDDKGSSVRLEEPLQSGGLENTHWSLISYGAPGARKPLVEGSTVTLMLADGQAGGSSGCNSYGGSYQVQGDTLKFGDMVATLMACENGPVMEQESAYMAALGYAGKYRLEDSHLIISYNDGAGEMVFEQPVSVDAAPSS